MPRLLQSLAFKWTATLLLTSLLGVLLAAVFISRTTSAEFDQLRSDQAQAEFVAEVTRFYESNGSWDGLELTLRRDGDGGGAVTGGGEGGEGGAALVLVDNDGQVIGGRGRGHNDPVLSPAQIAAGTPILVDGQVVATALLLAAPALDPREESYLNATNQALLFGALGAGVTAVIIGLLLSRQFLRPLSQLTQAITAMHAGELEQQVQVKTQDELGVLARAFNEMSANVARANHLRKQMTADIAHDLRTPLTVISGYVEALRDGTLRPTPERFAIMSEEIALLHRLLEDLRVLSLADAGELRLMKQPAAPSELLERVAASFGEQARAAGIVLQTEVMPTPGVRVDSERMVQVLGNLVTNALRHTPAGGTVTLGASTVADSVQLTVRDTGSGIAPEDLERVFDRFYRADPARVSDSGESGLGLAIARSIVEAHGGTIRATSTLGAGTTMTILLPAFRENS